ncbi:MAG: chemotaxis protein CheA [Methanophagales archaeon]|nr:chemotaxis protein CheA [Methanophagales archaeon]
MVDLSKYKELFVDESREHLQCISRNLLALEKEPKSESKSTDALNEIFREVHTLKSMAATMGCGEMEKLAHEMENVLDGLRRRGGLEKGEGTVDVLLECLDGLETLVEGVATGKTVSRDLTGLYKKLENVAVSTATAAAEKEGEKVEEGKEEGRKVEAEREGEEKEEEKEGEKEGEGKEEEKEEEKEEGRKVEAEREGEGKEEEKAAGRVGPAIRLGVEKIQALQNLAEELAIAKMRLLQIASASKHASRPDPELNEITATIDRLTSELQDKVMRMRLFPVGFLFDRFPRAVRDLSSKTGKKVAFIVTGVEIELDRLVLDEINDAVMHLLRNAVDHGIEKPEERKKVGKKEEGKVVLSARREGNSVLVSVEDDGRGMNVERLKKVAVEREIITSEEASRMKEGEVYELLGAPAAGLSTAKKITDVSGRGVGFDVVKSKVRSLGGSVKISSEKGGGTKVELRLPLTTAIIRSLLVGAGEEKYAIPLDSVREIVAVEEVEGKENFRYRGRVLPLLRLKKILDIPGSGDDENEKDEKDEKEKGRSGSVVVVERDDKLFGILVERLVGLQETVVKPLEGLLKDRQGFAGATILADGSVALILDVGELVQ